MKILGNCQCEFLKCLITFTIAFLFLSTLLKAQNDTISSDSLLDELSITDSNTMPLLPAKFLPTQRIFWGKNGIMRNFSYFDLTPEKRQNELKIRRVMLVTHQVTGFATLGGMIAQGIIGARLYNGDKKLKDVHETLGAAVNIGYFTTMSLALFAPPKMISDRKGYSSIKIHKALAIVHLSGMIATNILAGQLENHSNLRPYHRAAAYTAFASFAAAMIIIKF